MEEPFIENGRVMVPLRGVGDALSAQVDWDEENAVATVEKYGRVVKVKPGFETATINGKNKELDTAAQLIDGRIYVPLRFIAEALHAKVSWQDYTKTVIIKDNFSPPPAGYIAVEDVTWYEGELVQVDGYATIDNNDTTAWVTHMDEEGVKWLNYDFGETKSVDKIEILWSNPHQRYFVYDILSSEDGINWTTHFKNVQSEVVDVEKSGEYQTTDFPGKIKARYIKLNCYRNTKHNTINIKEVRFK